MAGTEQTKIEVLLDGRQASDQLKDLTRNAAELRMEMAKAYEANDAGKVAETEWELSKLDTRMKQLRKQTFDVKEVLNNLSGATMSDLRQAIVAVDARLNDKKIKRNSDTWNQLTEAKRTLIAEQKKLRKEMGATDGAIRKQRLSVADWVVSLGVVQRAFNGVKNFLRESLYSFNAFQKGVKGLSSLTGLTGNDLNYLSDQAKELSTSTLEGGIIIQQSATEITDAYKMIGSQRPELLKNKEALNQVTQDAIILSEAAEDELKPAAKALTNSLNQFNASADQSRRFINVLAAGSQAGAGDINYLSQAIEKSGTTANLMGLEFEQLVALIETVAPKFSEAAVAGNSIDKVLMEMKAKQIGYRDGVFDVNAALAELAGRFAKGELAASIFGKEHAKMVEVLVEGREEFSRYQEAVTGTNKALEQAATNTDTNDARLRQQKNRLEQLRIELGEKLTPLIGAFTSGTASLVKVLIPMVEIIGKYKSTAFLLAGVLTTLALKTKILHGIELLRNVVGKESVLVGRAKILGMNSHIAALKVQALVTGSATMAEKRHIVAIRQKITAMKTANAALAKTPWGLLAVGASMAIGLIIDLVKNTNKLSESQKRLNEIDQQYTGGLREQTGQMAALYAQIKKTNPGTQERIDLVNRLDNLLPGVIDKQELYRAGIADLEISEKSYRKELEKRIRLQANEAKFADLEQQKMAKEEKLKALNNLLLAQQKELDRVSAKIKEQESQGQFVDPRTKNTEKLLIARVEKRKKEIEYLKQEYEDLQHKQEAINFTSPEKKEITPSIKLKPLLKIEEPDYDVWEKEMENDVTEVVEKEIKAKELRELRQKQLADEEAYRKQILFQAKSAMEQEDILNNERLEKAGLVGVKMADLRKKEQEALAKGDEKEVAILRDKMGTLEALQKTYQANILRIKNETEKKQQEQVNKAINQELQAKKAGYEQELTELRIRQNNELADESLTAEKRKSLKEKHQQEERELTIRHTQDLITTIQDILARTKIDGIDLVGNIFTPEEKEKLEGEVLKLQELLSKLNLKTPGKEDSKQPASLPVAEVDVLGMTPEMWETFFTNLEQGKFGIEEMQAAANALMNVWGTVNDFMAAKEKKQLKQYEKNTKAKKAALDKQLDAGKISQEQYTARVSQLDAELDAKKEELELKQAKRQKAMAIVDAIINTAVGVTKAMSLSWPLNLVIAALVSTIGTAQIATIAAQPVSGAESGGYINVVRSQDGRHFKAKDDPDHRGYVDEPTVITGESGREFIVNNEAVQNPTVKPVLDVIDAAQQSGTIDRLDLRRYMPLIVEGRASGGGIKSVEDSLLSYSIQTQDPEIKSLLRKNIEMMEGLKNMEVVISMYGRNGLQKALKKMNDFERKTTYK